MKKKAVVEASKKESEKKRMKEYYKSEGKQQAYEASANAQSKKKAE